MLLDVSESQMAENTVAVGTSEAKVAPFASGSKAPQATFDNWTSGAGLLGMRERVEAHGGELTIDLDPAGGLSLHAWMPVVAQSLELGNA